MSTRDVGLLGVAAVLAARCTCTTDTPPSRDRFDSGEDAATPRDASIDAALDSATDAQADSRIDWPDASIERWLCEWPRGQCPPEAPYCCGFLLDEPPRCRASADGTDCLEWPSDETSPVEECISFGTQCPEVHPYCCSTAAFQTCAARVMGGWGSCALEE
jgi:hypothetical protein